MFPLSGPRSLLFIFFASDAFPHLPHPRLSLAEWGGRGRGRAYSPACMQLCLQPSLLSSSSPLHSPPLPSSLSTPRIALCPDRFEISLANSISLLISYKRVEVQADALAHEPYSRQNAQHEELLRRVRTSNIQHLYLTIHTTLGTV